MRNMVLVIDDEVCTFSTSSAGGKSFIADLTAEYGFALDRGITGKLPNIELTVTSYLHKNRAYGRIKVPAFKLLGWVDEAKYLALISGAGDSIVSDDPGLPEERADADRADYEEIPFLVRGVCKVKSIAPCPTLGPSAGDLVLLPDAG